MCITVVMRIEMHENQKDRRKNPNRTCVFLNLFSAKSRFSNNCLNSWQVPCTILCIQWVSNCWRKWTQWTQNPLGFFLRFPYGLFNKTFIRLKVIIMIYRNEMKFFVQIWSTIFAFCDTWTKTKNEKSPGCYEYNPGYL